MCHVSCFLKLVALMKLLHLCQCLIHSYIFQCLIHSVTMFHWYYVVDCVWVYMTFWLPDIWPITNFEFSYALGNFKYRNLIDQPYYKRRQSLFCTSCILCSVDFYGVTEPYFLVSFLSTRSKDVMFLKWAPSRWSKPSYIIHLMFSSVNSFSGCLLDNIFC